MNSVSPICIVADGPAATGKGTLGSLLQSEFGFIPLSSGMFYRAVAAYCINQDIDIEGLKSILSQQQNALKISVSASTTEESKTGESSRNTDLRYSVQLGNMPLITFDEPQLRGSSIGQLTPVIAGESSITSVVDGQLKQFVTTSNRSMFVEGRDRAMVFATEADLCIYLDVEQEIAAMRMALRRIGSIEQNENRILSDSEKQKAAEEAQKDLIARNTADTKRPTGTLLTRQQAQNSHAYDVVISTTNMTAQEVLAVVVLQLIAKLAE